MNTLHRSPAHHQSGVVLVIALVLLVVIGFSSAFILRGTLFGDLVSNNVKANQMAQHAAEVALRICEQRVLNPVAVNVPPTIIIPIPDNAASQVTAWQTQANWTANRIVIPVSAVQNNTNATTIGYNAPPECLIERLPLLPQDPNSKRNFGFQITARGFSPDYSRSSDGNIQSGAETILQLVLRMQTCHALLNQPDCP